MFNTLRKLFGKRVENTVDTTREPRTSAGPSLAVAPGFTPRSVTPRSGRGEPQPHLNAAAANAPSTLAIPLKAILNRLPPDLMQRVRQLDVGEIEVSVSMQKVLSQIAQGAVKLSFGELRQVSPPGTFTAESDLDRSLVDLPLHEVIARMNLALLPRRPAQKHVEVPPEVTGPFGGQCQIAISTSGPLKPAPPAAQPPSRIQAPPPPQRVQQPVAPIQPPQPAPRTQPVIARVRNAPSVPAVAPVAPAPTPAPPVEVEEPAFNTFLNRTNSVAPLAPPVPPAAPPQPVYSPIAPEPVAAAQSQPAAIPMSDIFRAKSSPAPITPIAPKAEPQPEPIRFKPSAATPAPVVAAAPAPAPAPAPQPAIPTDTRFLTVLLAEVSSSWPDAVKNEIVSLKAIASSMALPFCAVEVALKQGKVAFPWKALRAWLKPAVPVAPSACDGTVLELPLKIIAPLFLNEQKAGKLQPKVSVDKDIPDLFFDGTRPSDPSGSPAAASMPPVASPSAVAPAAPASVPVVPTPARAPVAPAPVAAAPVAPIPAPAAHIPSSVPAASPTSPAHSNTDETNFFRRNDKVDEAEEQPVFIKKDGTPGTAFLKRYATPNEIVNKAAALSGVDGALIGLPDGLLVASRIPSSMNADTVAAFLPQIFGKVSQCTRELRLGDLNNLNFTVGNIPWKIFKVGAIYFAAFGRAGEAMPTAQLAALAAELDHKSK